MLIDIHTHQSETAEDTLSIRSFCISNPTLDTSIPYSIGLHPYNEPPAGWLDKMQQHLQHPQCLMLGECGIDHLHGANTAIQVERLRHQVHLSEAYNKPIIIHSVRAHSEILSLHKQMHPSQRWIIHGFRGSLQQAFQYKRHGIILSFGSAILIDPRQIQILNALSPGDYLLETDDTNISISLIYESAARALRISPNQLESQILYTTQQLGILQT